MSRDGEYKKYNQRDTSSVSRKSILCYTLYIDERSDSEDERERSRSPSQDSQRSASIENTVRSRSNSHSPNSSPARYLLTFVLFISVMILSEIKPVRRIADQSLRRRHKWHHPRPLHRHVPTRVLENHIPDRVRVHLLGVDLPLLHLRRNTEDYLDLVLNLAADEVLPDLVLNLIRKNAWTMERENQRRLLVRHVLQNLLRDQGVHRRPNLKKVLYRGIIQGADLIHVRNRGQGLIRQNRVNVLLQRILGLVRDLHRPEQLLDHALVLDQEDHVHIPVHQRYHQNLVLDLGLDLVLIHQNIRQDRNHGLSLEVLSMHQDRNQNLIRH